ncbi:hypothetical protein LOK49_LG10G00081 [Camellia lanceoleosa]|uniref:Uncharacterized protein n=1 Tax=Camellia lanceoleosa TaxID=1840588 RepID=A0ACC0G5R4_9ERIC|nr:hypothetical protein LOK49_LG10G00081 [Camellia lanceoleosa]
MAVPFTALSNIGSFSCSRSLSQMNLVVASRSPPYSSGTSFQRKTGNPSSVRASAEVTELQSKVTQKSIFRCKHWESSGKACWKDCDRIRERLWLQRLLISSCHQGLYDSRRRLR